MEWKNQKSIKIGLIKFKITIVVRQKLSTVPFTYTYSIKNLHSLPNDWELWIERPILDLFFGFSFADL